MQKTILNIADFIVAISAKENIPFAISENYASFKQITQSKPAITLSLHDGISKAMKNAEELFRAEHDGSEEDYPYYWSVHQFHEDLLLLTSDPGKKIFPSMALQFNRNDATWKLHVSKEYLDQHPQIDPFLYPMGPLIMYYLTAFNQAFMIHASGINDGDKGYIFTGVSGIGKSTMARLWYQQGAEIINDDRLIVRKKKEQYSFYNTPMYYPDQFKKSPLNAIFILNQAKENRLHRIAGANAMSKIMANCIHHGYHKQLLNELLDTLSLLVSNIPVYELGFKPDSSVVELIRENGI